MFAINLKLSNRRLLFLLAVLVLIASVIVAVRLGTLSGSTKAAQKCSGKEAVAEYLTSFGLKIGEFTVDSVTVPAEFSDVYKNYNDIQRSQGFDLTDYKGKTLTRYTCPVTNYPETEKSVFAEVLLLGETVVAADIYSTELDGFISALK